MAEPWDEKHVLYRMYGAFGGNGDTAPEHWSASFRISVSQIGLLTEAAKLSFLTLVEPGAKTFHSHTSMQVHQQSTFYKQSAAYIDTTGFYLGGFDQQTTYKTVASPTSGGSSLLMPWSNALAIRLQTDIPRGTASKGRFYMPCAGAVEATGQYQVATITGAATQAKTFLDAVNTAAQTTWGASSTICVFSHGSKAPGGDPDPKHAPVTQVWVGCAPDTQRRRDNRVSENYQKVTLAAGTTRLAARDRVNLNRA